MDSRIPNDHLDVIIIGAGPTGIACGIAAENQNLNYLIIEKGVLANSIYNFPTNMTFFSTSMNLEIGEVPFISHNDKPTRQEALEYYRRVVSRYKLKIKYSEEAIKCSSKPNGGYLLQTSSIVYTANNIILATGFYDKPRMLGIPGEKLSKVKHYYDDAHLYVDRDIVVIGAANSACDVALETWQKGARVTMIIREDQLYEKVKYWILPNIKNRIKEGSIKAYFNSNVMQIEQNSITVSTPDGIIMLPNDYVLAMTGYLPDYDLLAKFGIDITDDEYATPVFDEKTFETNQKGIYLAGVLQGGLATSKLFIENTRNHGNTIINTISNQKK